MVLIVIVYIEEVNEKLLFREYNTDQIKEIIYQFFERQYEETVIISAINIRFYIPTRVFVLHKLFTVDVNV